MVAKMSSYYEILSINLLISIVYKVIANNVINWTATDLKIQK